MKRVAVVSTRSLGDALLSMILSHNLLLSGISVVTFSSILCELKMWFPGHVILPYPVEGLFQHVFTAFDTIIASDHSIIKQSHYFNNHLIILKEKQFNKTLSMVENLQRVCRHRLALPHFEKENGFVPLDILSWRAHPERVILHPMSSDMKKDWPIEKFILLSQTLQQKGYKPFFCVSQEQRAHWINKVPKKQLPQFATVHDLACFVYESGSMIGNDSGTGHLASICSIPTLSLFARKSYSQLWRPGWGPGLVVTPPSILPGSHLKQRYWKRLLSIRKVGQAHKRLLKM